MNIKVKLKTVLSEDKEYVFSIPELMEYGLEDPGGDEQTTARNNSQALGRLCEVMADKLQLTAEEVLAISGVSATKAEFC